MRAGLRPLHVRVTPGPVGPCSGGCNAAVDAVLPATDAGCEQVAALFRALSEPMRLKILRRLSRNEASVGEIVADVGGTQANVSKHLAILLGSALLGRRKEGTRTFYAIKDPSILRICSIVCDGVERGSADTSDGPPRRRRSEPSEHHGR